MDRYLRFNKKCKLALLLLLSLAGMGKGYAYSFSAVCPTGQTLYYNITDATNHYVKVTYPVYGWEGDDYTKPAGNLILPEIVEYDGNNYIVTSIGDDAFRNCDDLLSVNLSNSVKIIGNYAFVGCYSINSVTIPNSVTFIGAYAFSGCYTLTTIIIPNSVTVIGASAFDYCQELTSVDIPNSVYSIGDEAFYSCSKLSTITIGNSVKELGSEVFKNTKWYSNHSSGVLYLDGCCIGYKGSKPTGSLVIQDGTRLICDAAFRNCTGLTSVTIPNSVTSIGSGAFNGCSSLSTITIGNTVDHIGTAVFTNTSWYNSQLDGLLYLNNYCLGYKGSRPTGTLNLQAGTRVIAGKAFYYCTDLTSVTIPNSVVSIDEMAFTNCLSIVGELVIPDSVYFIGWDAFGSCRNLTSLTIGSSVAVMRNDAFEFCTSLTSINALPETPPSIIGPRTPFAYVPENIPVIVPCGSRELYQNADYFSRFSNIQESGYEISSVIYPTEGGVVTGAGNYCHGTSCTLTATPAEGYAFFNWTENGEVVSIEATYSFTVLGDRTLVANFEIESNIAFADATVKALCVTNWDTDGDGELSYAEAAAVTDLGSVFQGSGITSFEELQYFTGLTSIGDWAFNECSSLTSIKIPNSVTSIGYGAFNDCSSLTSIEIPNSVTFIGDYAFSGCSSLTLVSIGDSVTTIEEGAFWECTSLTSIEIPNSVTSIGDYTFSGCSSLTSIEIPNSVTSIGGYAFSRCSSLTSIEIPNSVTSIGVGAFESCISLTSIEIPNSVTSIGGYAFDFCFSLTSVIIPNSVTSIGDVTFYLCTSLTSIEIPNSVTSIGYEAFCDCSSLTSIEIPNSVTTIGGGAFCNCSNLASVTVLADIPPAFPSNGVFNNVDPNIPVYVLCGKASDYQSSSWGEYFSNFVEIYPYLVSVSSSDDTMGGATVMQEPSCDNNGQTVVTAMPNSDYTFVNWTHNGNVVSTSATYSFTPMEDMYLVANFTESSNANHWTTITGTQYNLTMSGVIYIDGVAQTSSALEVGAFCGDECRGSARAQYFPPTGEYVVSLAVVSNQQSGETITFRLYDHDTQQEFPSDCVNSITFVANANFGEMGNWYPFTFNHAVAVTATVTPEGAGVVEGTGDYLPGTSCTLTATANTGYTFVNWTENGEVVSTDNPYTFTVNGAVELTANFSLNSYDITASANPTEGGTITGSGTYDHFSTCTLTATANTGYAFQSWSVAGEVVSTDNPYTFMVSGGVDVVASFELVSYDITALANPTEAGAILGAGSYTYGSTCTLTATANTGYAFQSWSVAGEVVSIGGVEVMANFDAQETTALAEGWTWWSTSIELSGIDGLTMLEESLGHNGLMIKSANKFVQNYYPNTGYDYWFGQLTSDDFTNASSYMIQTSASCEVTMTGAYADPSDHPIQLYPGWTWIGYPCGSQQSATSAFAGFTPSVTRAVV